MFLSPQCQHLRMKYENLKKKNRISNVLSVIILFLSAFLSISAFWDCYREFLSKLLAN